jgi:N-acetylglucosamine-6-phosphate deacetylase
VFDGTNVHRDAALIIEDAGVVSVVSRADLPRAVAVRSFGEDVWLAPGFIDVQVNGGGDVLLNDEPTARAMSAIAAAHRRFGTTALLPTLISDTPEKMKLALEAAQTAVARDRSVLGIHLEGPFLSPERPGVHDLSAIRAPTREDAAILTVPRKGVLLVTLAPEQVPAGFIAELVRAGIRVSLGHSMATYAQARAALAEGLTGFTHLFNAMRPLASREPGPIAAALETPGAFYGLIVDGEHVAPPMLRLALRGLGQAMLVTDAMPPVGADRPDFVLYGETLTVQDGRLVTANGTLAGSALDMASAVRNCVDWLGVPLEEALRMASAYPADALGLGHKHGRLAPGYRADVVALDARLNVTRTWIGGA